jgi:alkylhydroperoxidase family enzyme
MARELSADSGLGWLGRGLVALRTHLVGRRSPLTLEPVAATSLSTLPAYLAAGSWHAGRVSLDARLETLVAQLSAELSACRWCIEQGRHQWRRALVPIDLLRQLRAYRTSALFSERDCAALGLAEAVARYTESAPGPAEQALGIARRHFSEAELVRIAQVAAGDHFFDPRTGAVGRDVRPSADPGQMPWREIASGIKTRGWL